MKRIARHTPAAIILLFILALPIMVLGQTEGSAGSFSRIGFGPRAMAMGNAFTAVTTEGVFGYYNPALAAFSNKNNQIDISTAAMSFDRKFHTASGTFPLPPSGGLAISVINANVSDIDGRTVDGYHTRHLSTSKYQISAAVGQQLSKKISAGIGIKYYLSDLHPSLDPAKTIGLDLGILYKITDRLQAGTAVQDLLASYTWNSGSLYGDDLSNNRDPFPTRISLGVTYKVTSKLLISVDGKHLRHEGHSNNKIQLGGRYFIHDLITLRGGWQLNKWQPLGDESNLSTGFSLKLPFDFLSSTIDYAFVQEPNNISYMHTFGIQIIL